MTSLKSGTRNFVNGLGPSPVERVGTALPIRQKRPGYAALAIVLIVGLAAIGAYFYSQAGRKVPVVVVTADVPAGHKIQRSDLSTVQVAGSVTAIGGAHLGSVVWADRRGGTAAEYPAAKGNGDFGACVGRFGIPGRRGRHARPDAGRGSEPR